MLPKSARVNVPLPLLAPVMVMVKLVIQLGMEGSVWLGAAGMVARSRPMTPVAVAPLLKEAPLQVRLKLAASSCVHAAAARRKEALRVLVMGVYSLYEGPGSMLIAEFGGSAFGGPVAEDLINLRARPRLQQVPLRIEDQPLLTKHSIGM